MNVTHKIKKKHSTSSSSKIELIMLQPTRHINWNKEKHKMHV